jgi:uncharacterized membrane protein YgcG
VAQVPAGEAFTSRQAQQVQHAVDAARDETGLRFSVYVGRSIGDVRLHAQKLHAALGDDAGVGVLVFVEPDARRVEIVTGETAQRRLGDRAAGLASLSMATSFAGGDLTGGIVNGLRMMSQAAVRPAILHVQENSNDPF